jgi:hypothetical protein
MSSALPPALYLSHERREKRSRVIEEWCVKPSVGSTNVSITDWAPRTRITQQCMMRTSAIGDPHSPSVRRKRTNRNFSALWWREGKGGWGAAGLKEVVAVPRCAAHSVYVHVRVFGCIHLHHPVDVGEVESSVRERGRKGREWMDGESEVGVRIGTSIERNRIG